MTNQCVQKRQLKLNSSADLVCSVAVCVCWRASIRSSWGAGDYLESVIINLQLSAAVGCFKDNSKGSSVTASLIVRGELDSLDTALCVLRLYSDVTAW